jgi:hypothetical protein
MRVEVTALPMRFDASVTMLRPEINATLKDITPRFAPIAESLIPSMGVELTNKIGTLKVEVTPICEIVQRYYLRVSPEEVQWITVYGDINYDVVSNVEWVASVGAEE